MTGIRPALLVALLAHLLAGGGALPWCGPDAWPQTVAWPDGRTAVVCTALPPAPSLDP